MKKDGVWYRYFTDQQDGFMLDQERYAKVRLWYKEKIASGNIPPCLFVVYPESPNAWKHNFNVCEQYHEEEKKLASALNKILELEENWCIKVDSWIRDLSIAFRSR